MPVLNADTPFRDTPTSENVTRVMQKTLKNVPVTVIGGELHESVVVLSRLVSKFPLPDGNWYKTLVYEVDIDEDAWVMFVGVSAETPERRYPVATRRFARSLTREYPDLHRRTVHIRRLGPNDDFTER